MTFSDEIKDKVQGILNEEWSIRDGRVAPKTEDVALRNGAVRTEAAFLYADLVGSTDLQKTYLDTFAAKAIRMYLAGASSIIRRFEGQIKSFDGDRVMGVFTGGSKCNNSVQAAFAIQWLISQVINPMVKTRHISNGTTPIWQAKHGIGIDVGETFIARAGVRNSTGETTHNDLIFTKRAPNIAAKLSSLRGSDGGPIVITEDVFDLLKLKQKTCLNSSNSIWKKSDNQVVDPYVLNLCKADYWRRP